MVGGGVGGGGGGDPLLTKEEERYIGTALSHGAGYKMVSLAGSCREILNPRRSNMSKSRGLRGSDPSSGFKVLSIF